MNQVENAQLALRQVADDDEVQRGEVPINQPCVLRAVRTPGRLG